MSPYYRDYSDFLAEHFPGVKMQKLAVNARLGCPNRDGTIGRGGCSYCLNSSFNPSYCADSHTISEQLARGREFFGRKYPTMRYLAYFQAYTGTHDAVERLMPLYREALDTPGVDGLIIATRPDCMPDSLLDALAALRREGRWIMVEYGAESSSDATLARVNRCHTWANTVDAVTRTAAASIPVGLHLIAGLPGETLDDTLTTVERACELPIDTLKIHQLQVIKGTRLAADLAAGREQIVEFSLDEYIDLCVRVVEIVPPHIAIDRWVSSSPPELLISPRWGLKNYQFANLLHQRLAERAIPQRGSSR